MQTVAVRLCDITYKRISCNDIINDNTSQFMMLGTIRVVGFGRGTKKFME